MCRTSFSPVGALLLATVAACSAQASLSAEGAALEGTSPPALTTLAVYPPTLTPAFSPSIHDYYVRCEAGENDLSVAMTAAPGDDVGISAPAASSGQENVNLLVSEGEAVVATASLGSETTEYWIRCLPHDFPALAIVPHPDAGAAPPGYYLVGNTLDANSEQGYAMALDVHGVPVWYGTTSNSAGGANVDIRGTDEISYVGNLQYTFKDMNGAYEVHSLESGGVATVMPTGSPLDEHELQQLPNGDYLVFSRPIETGLDPKGLGPYGASGDMVNCVISEVNGSGKTLWQWTATDHLDPLEDCVHQVGPLMVPNSAGVKVSVADPFHCNSIDVAANGDLLVSARHMNSIFLISRASGNIVWKMGGSTFTKDGAAYISIVDDALGGMHGQHDARFGSAEGTVTVFDDETDATGPARALVLSYDVAAGTAKVLWERSGAARSIAMGSFRVLDDGSRIIGWGLSDGKNSSFTEVDKGGAPLLDFNFPGGDSSYRAIKVPLAELNLDVMRNAVVPAE
jgi:hypothetical protein